MICGFTGIEFEPEDTEQEDYEEHTWRSAEFGRLVAEALLRLEEEESNGNS